MKATDLLDRLRASIPVIEKICNTSGVPSVSIGVLHHDEVVWRHNFGYRDTKNKKYATSDTLYGIGSLTKGFTAASIGQLLDSDLLVTWESPIQHVIPGYAPLDPKLDQVVTIADFLSHRTGLFGDMSIATQGDLEFLIPHNGTIRAVSNLETVAQLREQWIYNNWGYSLAGALVESLSKMRYAEHVTKAVIEPLGLINTSTSPNIEDMEYAEAHVAFSDSSTFQLPRALPFKGSIFEAAGGMYSTVNDMLKYAKAIMQAQREPEATPLKNIQELWSNHISLYNPPREDRYYGMGWIGTTLPGVVGLQGDNADLFGWDELPILGPQPPARKKAYYHQGAALGYYSALYAFPETRSAVIVMTNSIPLNDAADWIAQAVVSALFGFTNGTEYIELAIESRRRKLGNVTELKTTYDKIRRENTLMPEPLDAYTGRYYDNARDFFIEVSKGPENTDTLAVSFQGKEEQVYELRHLQGDYFEWAPDYNESAKRARFTIWDPKYFEIDFEVKDGAASSLGWARWKGVLPEGMRLTRESDIKPPTKSGINGSGGWSAQSILAAWRSKTIR